MRLSWHEREALVPASVYQAATLRLIATALDGAWGDRWAARERLAAGLLRELETVIDDLPCTDLDWTMRALALTEAWDAKAAEAVPDGSR